MLTTGPPGPARHIDTMSSTGRTIWRRARTGRRRLLSSPLRIVSVMIVLFGVLALETSDAMANGTAAPTFATTYISASSALPIQKTRATGITHATLTATVPSRANARTRVAATAAQVVAKPAALHIASATRSSAKAVTPPSPAHGYGCGPALSYLATHSAPGFHFECPGNALGHQAMTCINVAGVCPGTRLIVINVPCSAAYMNEASNSWVLDGLRSAPIDPYGYCG